MKKKTQNRIHSFYVFGVYEFIEIIIFIFIITEIYSFKQVNNSSVRNMLRLFKTQVFVVFFFLIVIYILLMTFLFEH